MRKEYTISETVCDCCGDTKENPIAIAGHYDSGWRSIKDKDLCSVCFLMTIDLMIDSDIIPEDDILKGMEEYKDSHKFRFKNQFRPGIQTIPCTTISNLDVGAQTNSGYVQSGTSQSGGGYVPTKGDSNETYK